MLLVTLVLGGVVIWLVNYWINSNYKHWEKLGIPYVASSPFRLLFDYFFTKKTLMQLVMADYKKLDGHKMGGHFNILTPSIMVRDADLVHRICIKDFSHFVDRSLPTEVHDLFTQNLSGLNGDHWRTLRHKMTPTFTSGKLKMMFAPIHECCDEVIAFINKKGDEAIEARDFMFKFVINVIGNVSFGLKVDALNEEKEKDNEFLNISRSFFQPSLILMIKFMITIAMPKVRKYIRFSIVNEKITTFFRTLVKDMIAHREKTGEIRNDFLQLMLDQKKKEETDSLTDSSSKHGKQKDSVKEQVEEPEDRELLDQLQFMQDGNENYKSMKVFTDDCIVAQTFLFISGGSETIGATLSFVLYELTQNPTYQQKVQEELDEVLTKQGFTYQAIRNMKYMEQFISESMRLHPVAPMLARVCTKDYKIPDTDILIEKGTFLDLAAVSIMNDPQHFPEPEKFNPDHFEDPDAIHPGASLSFGAGPRVCIAKRLAMLEMKMLLAAVLQHFNVKLSPKTKMPIKLQKSSMFQHVDGGIWLQFEKRIK